MRMIVPSIDGMAAYTSSYAVAYTSQNSGLSVSSEPNRSVRYACSGVVSVSMSVRRNTFMPSSSA